MRNEQNDNMIKSYIIDFNSFFVVVAMCLFIYSRWEKISMSQMFN